MVGHRLADLAVLALLVGWLVLGPVVHLDEDLLWSAVVAGVVGALGMAVVRRLTRPPGRR